MSIIRHKTVRKPKTVKNLFAKVPVGTTTEDFLNSLTVEELNDLNSFEKSLSMSYEVV